MFCLLFDSNNLNYRMDQSSVFTILNQPNLALSPNMKDRVFSFLREHIGTTSENLNFEVFSALAIVGQVADIKSVDSKESVQSGIPIETVLRHSGGLSKQSLLEVVTRQCNKWREAPVWLSLKIDKVKLSYRLYKKYRTIFESLSSKNDIIEKQSQFNLMAIFWIVFLLMKNKFTEDITAIQQTTILYCLFVLIFTEVVTQLNHHRSFILAVFKRQFSQFKVPNEDQQLYYRARMVQQLNDNFEWRQQREQHLDLHKLGSDEYFIERFLDDLSNNYDRFKINLPAHTVDQSSFLQLDKTLTPLSKVRNLRNQDAPPPAISRRMNFLDQQDPDEEPEPMQQQTPYVPPKHIPIPQDTRSSAGRVSVSMGSISPIMVRNNQITPLTSRCQNLDWVNKITSRAQQKQYEDIKAIFEEGTGGEYLKYQEQAMNKIHQSILEFTPSCMNFNKRQKSIYSFFRFFIRRVHAKHTQQERKALFKSNTSFDAFLCLVTNLFNYAYQSLQSSFRMYCKIFGITLIEGLIPFNWFGANIQMPKNIQDFLYDLEKKILIQQIWDDNEGYNLLIGQKNYLNQALLKRLRLHCDQRCQQLCQTMKIQDKQITKIVNLVRFILQKRAILLRDNKIDQIIVCSIASILSINSSRTFSLQNIFNHYNKMLYSLNINRSIFYDEEGKQLDLLHYYNYIFLEQVQQIISNEEQAKNILDTPIRLERKKNIARGIQITPISNRFKQVAIGAYGAKKLKTTEESNPNRFRSNIVETLKNMNIKQQQNDNQDPPSPSFGMPRTISFGDLNQKFK